MVCRIIAPYCMLNYPQNFLSLLIVLLHTYNLLNTTLKINQ